MKIPELYTVKKHHITVNTQLLVDKLLLHNFNRIMFASSSAVYGMPPQPTSGLGRDNAISSLSIWPCQAQGRKVLSSNASVKKSLRGFSHSPLFQHDCGTDSTGRLLVRPLDLNQGIMPDFLGAIVWKLFRVESHA